MTRCLKSKVVGLPIFFGNWAHDNEELDRIEAYMPFMRCYPIDLYNYWGGEQHNFRDIFATMEEQVIKVIDINKNETYFVLLALSSLTASHPDSWLDFNEMLQKRQKNIFIYSVIFDSAEFLDESELNGRKKLLGSGKVASLYYNSDAPTPAGERFVEYVSRLLGMDIDSKYFPKYDMGTAINMANHISRENFNSLGSKAGTLPKYPIRDGKPYFPILSIEVACPVCGAIKKLDRIQLDENGGATIGCHFPRGHRKYLPDIGMQFDDWPELNKFTQKKLKTA